jgi:hypothetical protein
MKSSEIVGQQIIDLAKEKNVDLKKFPEVQTAMGYDKNGGDLTAAELGAFMVRVAQQNGTKMSQTGKVTSPKKAATKINAITTQSFIIYAVRLSSITVRAANENSLER